MDHLCYSNQDRHLVEEVKQATEAGGILGYSFDVTHLRGGEFWTSAMRASIAEADRFHLLWSSNSMSSDYVREQCEYALSLDRPNFILPSCIEESIPPPPELLHLLARAYPGAPSEAE